jgi:hypothetical protein
MLTRVHKKKSREVLMTKPWKLSTMMDRRQFVCAGAAGLALSAKIPKAFAASYDLQVKGGASSIPPRGSMRCAMLRSRAA